MPAQQTRPSASNVIDSRRTRLAAAIQTPTADPASRADPDGLEVTDLRAFRLREPVSGRRYAILRIQTRSGLVGYGETASVAADELAQTKKIVLGKAATEYEVVRQKLLALPNLEAAVNIALLDIIGKFAKAPIYQLLGGPTRYRVRVMTTLTGDSDDGLLKSMRHAQSAGFRALAVPIPPPAAPNQGQAYVRKVRQRLDTLRSAAGEDIDFVLDGAGRLSPGDAASLAAAFERFHLLWFDEPCRVSNLSTLRKIASETVTPLGLGRTFHDAGDFQDLLREQVIDVLRPSLALNSLSQIRRIAAIAETYYSAVAPYHDAGPMGSAAGLHLAASLPNSFIQQIALPDAEADRQMRAEISGGWRESLEDGFARLPTGPGLGFTPNEAAFEKYKDSNP